MGGGEKKLYITSPVVQLDSGCFRFSYLVDADAWDLAFRGRLFVFVKSLENGRMFPVWHRNLYYGAGWKDVEIKTARPFGQYRVNLFTLSGSNSCGEASRTIQPSYANILLFIDFENNKFLKKGLKMIA